MRLIDISHFVSGTPDPAFAIDGLGVITAWNNAAADVFQISAEKAIGRLCSEVVRGKDADGSVCSSECPVRLAAKNGHLIHNFDMRVPAPIEARWFNVSVVFIEAGISALPFAVHILRAVDTYKRLETLLFDFLKSEAHLTGDGDAVELTSARTLAREASLTARELEVLRSVARGDTSATIAEALMISPKTVDNHLQHILGKLNAHSRLQAVLRAEHAGLI